jgi:hypothetical protein
MQVLEKKSGMLTELDYKIYVSESRFTNETSLYYTKKFTIYKL